MSDTAMIRYRIAYRFWDEGEVTIEATSEAAATAIFSHCGTRKLCKHIVMVDEEVQFGVTVEAVEEVNEAGELRRGEG
jgi:hypothetical protein